MTETLSEQSETGLPLPGASSSPLVAAEWSATTEGHDEMGITRMLILSRASRWHERPPHVPS